MSTRDEVVQAIARATHDAQWGPNSWLAATMCEQWEAEKLAVVALDAIAASGLILAKVEVGEMIVRNRNLDGVTVSDFPPPTEAAPR